MVQQEVHFWRTSMLSETQFYEIPLVTAAFCAHLDFDHELIIGYVINFQ